MAGNNNQSDTENANSEIRKAHFIVQHGDGDDDEAGSEISFLTLSNKGIHAEGIFEFLNWRFQYRFDCCYYLQCARSLLTIQLTF